MVHKALNFAMIVAIVIGGVLAWRTGEERSRLTSAYRRLAQITGDFTIADPSKAYFLALDTGEPLHFAWQIYLPPNYSHVFKYNDGGEHSWMTAGAVHTIVQVRIREDDQGRSRPSPTSRPAVAGWASGTRCWPTCCTIAGTRSASSNWEPTASPRSSPINRLCYSA